MTPTVEQARRIAVHAQALDGSTVGALETVRRLGFLQIDPISVVATPQELVLWSRLGTLDRGELDRLLWEERKLVEWNAFVWPVEDLPLLRARMRRNVRANRPAAQWLGENKAFRRHVLRELDSRGQLLSREIEDHKSMRREDHRWWGSRKMGLMLDVLSQRGEVAVAGRRGKQRVWDLADRVWPETEQIPWAKAEHMIKERRFRSLGVKLERGRLVVHPDADDSPVPPRVTFLSPFDRLIHDRARLEALWGFYYRLEMYVTPAKREYGYYVLPILNGDKVIGRIEPVHDRKAGVLRVNGLWWEDGEKPVSLAKPLKSLARFLGARLES